jgi:hypothetical protein
MAKDNIRYSYPTYADDAAVGGYNRKELRGLERQAKRGTLTQRERARYNYLKDERKGRRKRGLLSGLGGAAATIAALALAGKLGKGEGGGGAALMDAIKARIGSKKKKDQPEELLTDEVSSNMEMTEDKLDTEGATQDFGLTDEQRSEIIRKLLAKDKASKVSSDNPDYPNITSDYDLGDEVEMRDILSKAPLATSPSMSSRFYFDNPEQEKNLPQLEALEQLKRILGNRYN